MDITENENIQQKIRESEEMYQNLFEESPCMNVLMTLRGEIIAINSKISKILGYKPKDLLGHNLNTLIENVPKQFTSLIKTKFKEILSKDFMEPIDLQIFDNNRNLKWIIAQASKVELKEEILIQIIIQDVTEKKEAEDMIKESEEKFRIIAEQSLMGIAIFQDDLIRYVNKRLADLLGYSVNEILNWREGDYFKTIPSDMKKKIIQLAQILKNDPKKSLFAYQSQGITKSGERIWLEVYLKPIIFLGKFAYLATFIDITDQKKAEQKLKESEAKYRHLFSNSPYAIILADSKGNIIDCNTACKQLFPSIIDDENIDKNFRNLFSNLKNSEKVVSLFNQKYEKLLKGDIADKLEIELIKADGKRIWLNFRASLVKIDEKLLIQMIVQDITDKKEAERIILGENKRLSEINQIKNEIVSRVSHELKTPLNSMYGAAQVLLNLYKNQISPKALEFVEMINKGGNRLKLLIENLLDISKLESKEIKLIKIKENLVDIMKECVENIRYMANERNLILNLELPYEAYIDIDKIRIEQVITNLLSNAIKNTLPLGTISIDLKNEKDWVEFSIQDTGIGFTRKELNGNLFKKFG